MYTPGNGPSSRFILCRSVRMCQASRVHLWRYRGLWEDAEVVDHNPRYRQRCTLEAWHIRTGLIPHACKLSSPSNTFIHTLFPIFYVYKVCHLSFVSVIPLMKVLDWTATFGIYSKLILAGVVPSIVPCNMQSSS